MILSQERFLATSLGWGVDFRKACAATSGRVGRVLSSAGPGIDGLRVISAAAPSCVARLASTGGVNCMVSGHRI